MTRSGLSPTLLNKLEKISRLTEIACTPGGARALRRWRPFSVAAFRLVQGLVAEGLSFSTIIDVGANVGKFSRAALGFWPEVTVIAFEPLPDVARSLEVQEEWAKRIEIHVVALGATDGRTAFYPHKYSLASSPLPVAASVQERYEWAREMQPIDVPLRRLDGVLAGRELRRPILLKLDVQGFELEVLKGAPDTLAGVDAVLLEQSFDSFYQGQALFSESDQFLRDAGWRLVRPLDWRKEHGRIVEVDCLYIPL